MTRRARRLSLLAESSVFRAAAPRPIVGERWRDIAVTQRAYGGRHCAGEGRGVAQNGGQVPALVVCPIAPPQYLAADSQ